MGPVKTSFLLRRIAAAMDAPGQTSQTRLAGSLRLVLALLEGGEAPQEVVDAFRVYLDEAVDDNAYVELEDFIGTLDFLGLLKEHPQLQDMGMEANGVPFGWKELVDKVSDEFELVPQSGRESDEWDVARVEETASSPLTERPDYG